MAKLWPRVRQIARARSFSPLRWPVFAFALLAWFSVAVQAATFTATLDKNLMSVGDSATLTLRFDGGSPRVVPSLPAIPNLHFEGGGVIQGYTAINGQASSYIAQTYSVTATQPGDYVIPALESDINGETVRTQPLRLKVVKSEEEQNAFFRVIVPKKEVFIGEVIPVEFQVCFREGLNGEGIFQQFEQFSGCPLKAEGVSFLKTAHVNRRQMQVGNFNYNVVTLVSAVTPVKAGTITITSMDLNLTVQIPRANRDPYNIFQQFDQKHIYLTAPPQTFTALPLPRTNVPPTFTGAVGNYSMNVTAGPTNVTVGDPVTVKIMISGRGAFDALTLPEQTAWRDFKIYPATTKFEPTDALGLQGTKTFEQLVAPQNADIKDVPPVTFSFFNPDRKMYQTLTHGALPLVVHPGGAAAVPTIAATTSGAQEAPPTPDIVHIKPRFGALAQIGTPLATRPWFIVLQGVPVLLWLSALIWRRRTESLANNPRLRRQRQVAQLVRDGLAQLRTLAAENKSEAFFATLVHLLQEQLGERLNVPASAITEEVIDDKLRPKGAPESILTPLRELFQLCNLVRYAPIKTSQELAAIIPKLESVLRDLQGLNL